MFIPIENDGCLFLQNAVAMIRDRSCTRIYFADGSTAETAFRPVTLARRYDLMMKNAQLSRLPVSQKGDSQ